MELRGGLAAEGKRACHTAGDSYEEYEKVCVLCLLSEGCQVACWKLSTCSFPQVVS